MAKKNTKSTKSIKVARCECDKCGQIAHASPDTAHMSCAGFPETFFQRFPRMRGRLKGKEKGSWKTIPAEVSAETAAA